MSALVSVNFSAGSAATAVMAASANAANPARALPPFDLMLTRSRLREIGAAVCSGPGAQRKSKVRASIRLARAD
jgi:hypothetical protein